MTSTLALTALLMGLAGGPHCIARCGAACGGIARAPAAAGGVHSVAAGAALFQAGRLTGYALAGAAAAVAMQSLAWMSSQTAVLRPLWTLLHVAVLAWGMLLVVFARPPVWADQAGRSVWSRVRPLAVRRGGVFVIGMAWALMPCGLLYSALLVAALSGGPVQGALSMALFAVGSSVSLTAGPWLWQRLRSGLNSRHQDTGTRVAGLLLCGVAGWALWMDLQPRIAEWCA